MSLKIAVLGTGANGSCIAASLIDAGLDVTLIDQWPAHVEAMRQNGLKIAMPDREQHVTVRAHHLCDVCTFREPFDVVLLAVKAYDTRWACELIKPHLAENGMVIGMQNCMVADVIREVIGPGRSIACVIELSSEMFTPAAKIRVPSASSRKLVLRVIAWPEIAPIRCPTRLDPTRGSKITGTAPLSIRPGLTRATVRSPARRPISAGSSSALRCRAL